MNSLIKKYIIFLLIFSSRIYSQEIKFYGEPQAGGIIIGKGENVKAAWLNNKKLTVDKKGIFVFGFDRDAKGKFILKVELKNGEISKYEYDIEKRLYEVQKLTVQKKYVTPPKKELSRIEKEAKIIKDAYSKIGILKSAMFSSGFVYPVDTIKITGVFGSQRILNRKLANIHNGVDFAANEGDSIYAISDGIVQLAEENFYFNGNFVLLNHGQGLSSIYLHLSKVFVKNGDKVKKGEVIGLAGSTGRSTGPHLHLGVKWYNKRIDPMSLLEIKEIE
ncbi:MAG: M23 family metallopeptidase [Melioribacter sp.]|uniref:M23 family metallopeptidase n=1 Tax=Rosettibacter primus TaxID=3111523 RepID=UPI00247C1437|nr:M23 family metallopeptidase [Melioribacter sp.]